ncbi:uncharacterized protein LOC103575845 isoform X2 [Microplitis demolitor]|uniref:uncharacterized protein LOC103575845 isoform X2 n=1 Tax=Microplitis demolitor TaxID=69319 RepID=UPI00235B5E85|nr:uncharacterized protein LOC103575845 isoform X2 [Microplitis demolitor]
MSNSLDSFLTRIGDVTIERVTPRGNSRSSDRGDCFNDSSKPSVSNLNSRSLSDRDSEETGGESDGEQEKKNEPMAPDDLDEIHSEGSGDDMDLDETIDTEIGVRMDSERQNSESSCQDDDVEAVNILDTLPLEGAPIEGQEVTEADLLGKSLMKDDDIESMDNDNIQSETQSGDEEDDEGSKRRGEDTSDSDPVKKKQKKDDSSDDPECELKSEKKLANMRRNIREVMDETQLDEATLAAQRQEMERLRRVQEQQKIIREVQRQIAINRHNNKNQSRVISLLQGKNNDISTSIPESSSSSSSQVKLPSTVLLKVNSNSGSGAQMSSGGSAGQSSRRPMESSRWPKGGRGGYQGMQTSISRLSNRSSPGQTVLQQRIRMMTPSVSISPVVPKKEPCDRSYYYSDSDVSEAEIDDTGYDKELHSLHKISSTPKPQKPAKGKDVVTISSSSESSDDDCIVLSDPSGGEETDNEDDPSNSGMHTNDRYNVPDEHGRVLVNVGHPDTEPDVFLAPQVARVIKPHQIGGIRFLFDNIVESIERYNGSSGFGCILAHSMGLGKTLQVASFCDIFFRCTPAKTVLCIMPINTLQNWLAEFNMWLPYEDPNAVKSDVLSNNQKSESSGVDVKHEVKEENSNQTDISSTVSSRPISTESAHRSVSDSSSQMPMMMTGNSFGNSTYDSHNISTNYYHNDPVNKTGANLNTPNHPSYGNTPPNPIYSMNLGQIDNSTPMKKETDCHNSSNTTPGSNTSYVIDNNSQSSSNIHGQVENLMQGPLFPGVDSSHNPSMSSMINNEAPQVPGYSDYQNMQNNQFYGNNSQSPVPMKEEIKTEFMHEHEVKIKEEPKEATTKEESMSSNKEEANDDKKSTPKVSTPFSVDASVGMEIRPRHFKLHILNDSHKNMAARARVIQDWQKNGGVLLIGYELYRQLSLKKPNKGKRKRGQPLKDTIDIEEEDKNKGLLDDMHAALVNPGPDLVICDEGHRIKNSHASISMALKQMRTKRRIVLTGYPLQNNLLEYWCMVDFVRPNYLGSKSEFCNMFERPIQNGQCIDSTPQDIRLMRYRAHVLHALLEGFVQRRSHSVLQVSLPRKEEYIFLVRMTPFQRKLYDTFMNQVLKTRAVPNPLKAFAVCCKIWNHPDILFHFLRKRQANEEDDLDLEETMAEKANSGGKRTKARQTKGESKRGKKVNATIKNKPAASVPPNSSLSSTSNETATLDNSQSDTKDNYHNFSQQNINSNFTNPGQQNSYSQNYQNFRPNSQNNYYRNDQSSGEYNNYYNNQGQQGFPNQAPSFQSYQSNNLNYNQTPNFSQNQPQVFNPRNEQTNTNNNNNNNSNNNNSNSNSSNNNNNSNSGNNNSNNNNNNNNNSNNNVNNNNNTQKYPLHQSNSDFNNDQSNTNNYGVFPRHPYGFQEQNRNYPQNLNQSFPQNTGQPPNYKNSVSNQSANMTIPDYSYGQPNQSQNYLPGAAANNTPQIYTQNQSENQSIQNQPVGYSSNQQNPTTSQPLPSQTGYIGNQGGHVNQQNPNPLIPNTGHGYPPPGRMNPSTHSTQNPPQGNTLNQMTSNLPNHTQPLYPSNSINSSNQPTSSAMPPNQPHGYITSQQQNQTHGYQASPQQNQYTTQQGPASYPPNQQPPGPIPPAQTHSFPTSADQRSPSKQGYPPNHIVPAGTQGNSYPPLPQQCQMPPSVNQSHIYSTNQQAQLSSTQNQSHRYSSSSQNPGSLPPNQPMGYTNPGKHSTGPPSIGQEDQQNLTDNYHVNQTQQQNPEITNYPTDSNNQNQYKKQGDNYPWQGSYSQSIRQDQCNNQYFRDSNPNRYDNNYFPSQQNYDQNSSYDYSAGNSGNVNIPTNKDGITQSGLMGRNQKINSGYEKNPKDAGTINAGIQNQPQSQNINSNTNYTGSNDGSNISKQNMNPFQGVNNNCHNSFESIKEEDKDKDEISQLDKDKEDKSDDEILAKDEEKDPKNSPVGKEDVGIPYEWATELMKGYVPGLIDASAKMTLFFCILEEAILIGDRVLAFSQSLFTLNLIEDFLARNNFKYADGQTDAWVRNVNYYRLDGSTSALEREKLINEFNQNPKIHLFLVSTRAGSLGINLVGANRAIVFDASWNPCHDTQAVCRVYRYGQKKPCYVYRLVTDNCLERKIYDRQISKQGMADRVVDQCNPDAHLSLKEATTLSWDWEEDSQVQDFSSAKNDYTDEIMHCVLERHSSLLTKQPFHHESLLVDRKDKKLSQAEKRLARRGYELEKMAANCSKPSYNYVPGNTATRAGGLQIRAIRGGDTGVAPKPVASVRPMQQRGAENLGTRGIVGSRWIPAEVWQRQGMSAQEMTLPLDVVIPTNSPDKSSIVLKSGQRVMVLKSPKGIYMQLESGKIIAIRTALKINQQKRDEEPKKAQRNMKPEVSFPLRNNSAISIIPKVGGNSTPAPRIPPRPNSGVGYRSQSDRELTKRSRAIPTPAMKVNLNNQVSLQRIAKGKLDSLDHSSVGENSNSSDSQPRTDQRVEEVRLEDIVAEANSNSAFSPSNQSRATNSDTESGVQKRFDGKTHDYGMSPMSAGKTSECVLSQHGDIESEIISKDDKTYRAASETKESESSLPSSNYHHQYSGQVNKNDNDEIIIEGPSEIPSQSPSLSNQSMQQQQQKLQEQSLQQQKPLQQQPLQSQQSVQQQQPVQQQPLQQHQLMQQPLQQQQPVQQQLPIQQQPLQQPLQSQPLQPQPLQSQQQQHQHQLQYPQHHPQQQQQQQQQQQSQQHPQEIHPARSLLRPQSHNQKPSEISKNLMDSSEPVPAFSGTNVASVKDRGPDLQEIPAGESHALPQAYPYTQYPRYYDYPDPRSRSMTAPYGSYFPNVSPTHSTNPRSSEVTKLQPEVVKPSEERMPIPTPAVYSQSPSTVIPPLPPPIESSEAKNPDAISTIAIPTTTPSRTDPHISTAFSHPSSNRYTGAYPSAPYNPYSQHYPAAPNSSGSYPPSGAPGYAAYGGPAYNADYAHMYSAFHGPPPAADPYIHRGYAPSSSTHPPNYYSPFSHPPPPPYPNYSFLPPYPNPNMPNMPSESQPPAQ